MLKANKYTAAVAKIAFALAVAFAVEVAFFNFESVKSVFLKQVYPEAVQVSDGSLGQEYEYSFDSAEITDVKFHTDLPRDFDGAATVTVFAKDEGNATYYELGEMWLGDGSTYFVHPAGSVSSLLFRVNPVVEDKSMTYGSTESIQRQAKVSALIEKYKQDGIDLPAEDAELMVDRENAISVDFGAEFNVAKPFDLSKKRIAVIFLTVCLFFLIRPSSFLHKRSFNSKPFLLSLGGVAVIGCAAVVVMHLGNVGPTEINERQYFELAKAFASGSLAVGVQPSPELVAMENPYDTNLRTAMQVPFLWDYAYFEGSYYVYFGALPALLFHLPFYLLCGGEFPNSLAVLISAAAFCAGLVFLLKVTCDRWFPRCSQAMFTMVYLAMLLGSQVFYACLYPGHYVLPIILGLALLVWGWAFWVKSTADRKIKIGYAVAGSVCVALVLACRPQLLIGAVMGVVLLGAHLKEHGKRGGLKILILALVPFAMVVVAVCLYNHARFGGFFDFGANYNLTTNDMTQRGFVWDRIPLALFSYLFQAPSITMIEPYLNPVIHASNYFGLTIEEDTFGGIFMLCPILMVVAFLLFREYRERCAKPIGLMVLAMVASAIVLVAFDANGAGILQRYYLDFGLLLAYSAALTILSLWPERYDDEAISVEECGRTRYRAVGLALVMILGVSAMAQVMWIIA